MELNSYSFIYRALRKILIYLKRNILEFRAYLRLWGNGVHFDRTLICNGLPIIDVHRTGLCKIGNNCSINSNINFNPIGRYSPTFIIVRENAKLIIGNNVGISSSAIVCHKEIIIGDNVKMGGNVTIYDTDFHSLNAKERINSPLDKINTIYKPVIIEDDVFIGAHSTILKGVTVGKGAIIGAGSVVTKNILPNEIWAGNPAHFIKNNNI
ncbi:acyltransferase [Emticicia agri]|uniref:Acyltransferase n=1 Tax=Emticicia agri TaxID=2492393 RepID=A0A4V1ZCS9_9BACT|nr:acyltransferase [Emticicia agri]RYU93720.1 acyltransferase [Emticicia agri]